jgi:hypothetical protein
MIEMTYYNDHKEKFQSHEIAIREHDFYNAEVGVSSHNPFDIVGYGATKEEALRDFMKKFDYVINEWTSFAMMLFETDFITDNIVEVDCMGKEI